MDSHSRTQQNSVTRMVQIALLIALEVIMTFTPLGFIMIPFLAIKATLVHIPVIVGGAVLGPGVGGILGGVFGLCSMLNNTFYPGITSFVFSPLISAGIYGTPGVFKSLFIAMVPRILVGVVAGLLAQSHKRAPGRVRLLVTGVAASMTNTILVMFSIYLLYGRDYADAIGKSYEALLVYIFGVISFNGVIEAVLGGVVTAALVPVLLKVQKRS